MQLNEHRPFFTSIFTAEIDVSHLVNDVLDIRDRQRSISLSNRGGWHSTVYNGLGGDDPFINPVFAEIDEYMQTIKKMYDVLSLMKLHNYWYNINNRYNYNIAHTHPFCMFSGCLYFKVPENSGNIVFERPDPMTDYQSFRSNNERNFSKFEITPHNNLLVIFPSYLRHSVEQNLTEEVDDNRITMAFNYR